MAKKTHILSFRVNEEDLSKIREIKSQIEFETGFRITLTQLITKLLKESINTIKD